MKWSFVRSIFLKRSLVFPILCFPLFLCIDHWRRLSYISPCYCLELCIQMGISLLFLFISDSNTVVGTIILALGTTDTFFCVNVGFSCSMHFHLSMKCSLGISNFLKEISSLSHSVVFLYFFALITEEGFLIPPCSSLEICIQMDISFLFSFAFQNSPSQAWAIHEPWTSRCSSWF